MPKRTNLFQEVVEIIHRHMAGDLPVESPAMLRHKVTGKNREVDVVIRSNVAGQEVVVAVEATAKGRAADVQWVEQMLEKHHHLPTNKLVLVSESGFTPDGRSLAEAGGAVPLAPEDMAEGDPAYRMNNLRAIWPKTVALTPERARVWVRRPDGKVVWFKAPADLWVFSEEGGKVGTLVDCLMGYIHANFPKIMEDIGLADIAEDRDQHFELSLGPPVSIKVEGRAVALCAQDETPPAGPELHPIERIHAVGRAVIEVARVDLTHRRLGDISFAYGEARLGEKPALLVVSEGDAGGTATLRLRDVGDGTGPVDPAPA